MVDLLPKPELEVAACRAGTHGAFDRTGRLAGEDRFGNGGGAASIFGICPGMTRQSASMVFDSIPIDRALIEQVVVDGSAMASLARDQELRDQHRIAGSPTYVLDNGRQKLFGNVGYRVIEANVMELLAHPESQASWC